MEFGLINTLPDLARIPAQRDTVKRITSYGADNLYPERIKQVFLLSPIAKSCVSLLSSFIRGDGFERGDTIVNDKGDTANDILRLISEDRALFNGYGIHVNSTGLGVAHSLEYVDFSSIRLGMKNTKGEISDVRTSINWSGLDPSLPDNELRIQRWELYDPAKAGSEAMTSAKGMMLYNTPRKNHYPLSAIDAILEDCQSNHELSLFTLGNVTNGFLSMSIFKYPSGGDSDTEQEELSKKLNQLKGAKNSNSIIVASIDEDAENTSNLVEQIPANNNDSLFINSTINVRNSIIGSFAMPRSLVGHTPESSLFTAQQIADDYLYMNLRTKDIRNEIERVFNERLGMDLGKIIPNQFADATMAPTLNDNPQI
jgi:hypothetical protein